MASIQLSAITGTTLEEILNAIERQRKDIEFIMANLDDDNIKEVSGEKVTNLEIDQAQIRNLLVDTANIKDLAVSNAKIANASITTAKIEDAAITNAKIDRASINKLVVVTADIQDAAITTAKIGDAQITTAKIQNAQIIGAHIADAQILTAHIKDAQITSAKIASATIETANIKDAAITTAKIGTAQITTGLIKDAAITEALIADLAVSDAKIVSITANKLTAGTIDASKISVTNLVADNIVTGTITVASANLFMNSDHTGALWYSNGFSNVGLSAALAPDPINTKYLHTEVTGTGEQYAYLERVALKENQEVTISFWANSDTGHKGGDLFLLTSTSLEATEANKQNTGYTDVHVIPLTADGKWNKYVKTFTMPAGTKSGYIRMDNNGVNTAGTGIVNKTRFGPIMVQYGKLATKWQPHTNELLADKGITNLHIGDSAVDNRVITANTITGDKLVVDAITTREIKAGSITAASGIIANATIGTAQIIDSAITTAKIGDAQITNAKISSLDAAKITTGYLAGERIAADTITSTHINVTNLAAISANLGSITAGNITGVTITGSTVTSASGTNSITLSGATLTSKVNNRDMVKISGSDISIYDDGLNDPTPGYGLLSSFGSGYTVETPEERGFQITNYGDFFAVGKKINTVTERHLFTDYKKRESIISGSPEDAEGTGTLNLRSSFYSTNRGNYLPGIQIINSGNYAGIYNYFGRNNDAGADATDYFLYDVRMYTGNNAGGSKSMIMARRAGTEYRVEVADNLYSSGKIHGAQQPYFMSGTGADVALGAGAWTRLNLNSSPQKNIGGGSFASGEYTVPDAGQYLVEAVINITPTGGSTYYISAFYNGVHYDDNRMAQKQASGGYDNILAGSTIVNCNAGDTISLRAYASTATTIAFQYMKIYKLP